MKPIPEEYLREYRLHLVTAEQKAQEDFDKTVLSLSGGALGISFAFIKDVVGSHPLISPGYLLGAWIAWGVSIISVLASYYFSQQALRKAISQLDSGDIHSQPPGGVFARLTAYLNVLGGVLFLVGVILITIFVSIHLK